MRKGTMLFAVMLLAAATSQGVAANDAKVGFVKAGAFVVPKTVNATLKSRQTRLRTGYLPVGTIVWVGDCSPLSENASSGIPQERMYCEMASETGIGGLIRQDLVHFLKNPVVVALANEEIPVYSTDGSRAYSPFSRNSGVYVDVLHPPADGVISVLRPYTKPEPIAGVLKIQELGNKVRYIDPKNLRVKKATVQPLLSFTEERVKDRFGPEVESYFSSVERGVEKLDSKLDFVQGAVCLLGAEVFAELGVRFLGTGAGGKMSATLKKSGETFGFDAAVLSIGGEHTIVASISRYTCTSPPNSRPEWLAELFSVGAPQYMPSETLMIKGRRDQGDVYVVQKDPKMFKINRWEDYERQYVKLSREIRQEEFVKRMSDQASTVYSHYILSKLADYQDE